MDVSKILDYLINLNWQTIIAIFVVNWYFARELKEKIENLDKRMDRLDERMFLLSTGKTLAQAILEEKTKNIEKHV